MEIYQISKCLHTSDNPSGSRQMRRSRLHHSIFPAIYIALLAALLTACTEEEYSSTFIDLAPGCAAQTLSWNDAAGNNCSADVREVEQDDTLDLIERLSPTLSVGTARFRCDNEVWVEETSNCVPAPEGQRTLDISLTANDGSRAYEYFSDAFAELGKVWGLNPRDPDIQNYDGFYMISMLPAYVKIGGGETVFPFGGAWDDIISIIYDVDGTSGFGTESVPIIDAEGDIDKYIPGAKLMMHRTAYDTSIEVHSGTLELLYGKPVRISSLDATITLSMVTTIGEASFDGPLNITNDVFQFRVGPLDPVIPSATSPLVYHVVWQATGVVNPASYR